MTNNHKTKCAVCGKPFLMSDLTPGRFVRPLVADRIKSEHPEWNADSYVCHIDLNHYRSLYVQNVLEQERGELSTLEHLEIQQVQTDLLEELGNKR